LPTLTPDARIRALRKRSLTDTERSRRDGKAVPVQIRSGAGRAGYAPEYAPFLLPAGVSTPRRDPTRWERLRDRHCRTLNVVVAVLSLILALPLMVLIALAVKLTSRGPVVYSQERVGLDQRSDMDRRRNGRRAGDGRRKSDLGGRIFTIYKFRTMYTDDSTGKQVWATEEDHRITPIGRVLRRFRLDELPQLFNVLKGDMNVVGPRPEQPAIFQELREEVEGYRYRQRVLPGITGWAQVNHHYDTCVNDVRKKVTLDLEYIGRRSAVEDLRIMLRTVPVMICKRGSL
jgi:lipopolysaccharide/colanic/teichoic acid biosynthesis glycosyltransferase